MQAKKGIATALILLALIGTASATNYYVRAGANGDGTDWENALPELPPALIRGDTYYIADGEYRSHIFNDQEDGEKYIYIKKAIESDHGTNIGWRQEYGNEQAVFINPGEGVKQTWKFLAGYYIMDGQVGGGIDDWDGSTNPLGFKVTGPADDDTSGMINLIQLGNFSDDTQNPDYTEFHHIEVTPEGYGPAPEEIGSSNPFYVFGISQNVSVANETLEGAGVTNILIRNSYFHDNHFHLFTDSTIDWIIEYNYFKQNYNNGEDASHQENGSKYYGTENMTIRYNIWENNSGSGTLWFGLGDQRGGSDDIDVRDVYIYGNAFYYSDSNQFGNTMGTISVVADLRDDDLLDNFNVYNNSFIHLNGLKPGVWIDNGINTITNVRVHNNIFYDIDQEAGKEQFFLNATNRSHNWFYDVVIASTKEDSWLANSETNAQIGTENPFVDWQALNFNLTSATDTGLNLPAPYNVDMFGNIRGEDGTWDRGAIEFQEAPDENFYYIRSGAACGASCDGSDWENAWTDLSQAGDLQRGATYFIADGTYGRYTFDDAELNDSQGNPLYITIKKAVSYGIDGCSGFDCHGTDVGWNPEWGDEQAVFINPGITGPEGERNTWKFYTGYYIMDGQIGGGPGDWDGSADGKAGCGFKVTGPTDDEMSFNSVHIQLGNYYSAAYTPTYCEFHHIEITAEGYGPDPGVIGDPFSVYGIANSLNTNQITAENNGPTNISVRECYFHHNSMHIRTIVTIGIIIEYSYFYLVIDNIDGGARQQDAMKNYGPEDMIIRYNLFEDNAGTGTLFFGCGSPDGTCNINSDVSDVYIYGNVFHNTVDGEFGNDMGTICIAKCTGDGDVLDNFNVYDNSFLYLHTDNADNGVRADLDGDPNKIDVITDFRIYNNIFYNITSPTSKDAFFEGATHRGNNWFYKCVLGGNNEDTWLADGETNGTVGTGDPFVDWQNMNFNLSSATDAGIELPWMNNIDMFGNIRGADGTWDRGAIEFQGAGECVDTPALLNYISEWKQGQITMLALMQKIALWKTGC